jgi:hypothetical protein
MKRAQALTFEAAPATALSWALLVAEACAALLLLSSGRIPDVLVRSLQLFLRF